MLFRSTKQCSLIAIDSQGRYYDQEGRQGLLADMRYLADRPERLSYVANDMTTARARMLFLYRLEEPLALEDGEQGVRILYYGIAENMEQLNPYFDCKAYNGNNSTYVIDEQGLKLFSGSENRDLLEGFNVFSVLRSMEYLHDYSFDDTLQTMQETGLAYSNAVLDGEEYYYALYRMTNSQWILLFLVPSRFVATNTVRLVNSTTKLLLVFAVFMTVVCAALIYVILWAQQKKALRIADETNAALEAGNARLQEAQAETAKALRAAEAASRAKTDFLSNMSHDIRTPMNAIMGITKLIAHDKDDPEKVDAYIKKVDQSSQHLLSLINDVLDMSKIESGEVTLNRESVDIAEQIRQVESIVRPQAEEREQKLAVSVRNIAQEYLIGDAVRLRQVFLNLLSNAIKYTPRGGSIFLRVEELACEKPDHVTLRISVRDTGYGMTPEFMSRVFEPFTRAESSTTNRVQGTGLGMAITRNIVNLAGGTISVQSEVNKGSCFTVEMPFQIDYGTKTELPIRSALLISDDRTLADNVRAAFDKTDAALTVVASRAEADAAMQQQKPELILLGGSLEGRKLQDHIALLRAKAGEALLLYCCDYEERGQLAQIAENGGVDGVLVRPFFLSDLARLLKQTQGENAPDESESTSILKGMRFLCAEDNAMNAEILEAVLDMKGAGCVIYPNGQELVNAFAKVKPGDFDAILMDVQMPVMNGLDATRAIRRSENSLGRTIPIIAMTANAFSEDVQNCLNAGMDAHVSKPLDIPTLERTIKSVLGGKFSGGDNCFPIEDKQ